MSLGYNYAPDSSQCGPCGNSISSHLAKTSNMNAAFSQYAWEAAKQEGCRPCPDSRLPDWPPKPGNFIYPSSEKKSQSVGRGSCCPSTTEYVPPFGDNAPSKTTANNPFDKIGGCGVMGYLSQFPVPDHTNISESFSTDTCTDSLADKVASQLKSEHPQDQLISTYLGSKAPMGYENGPMESPMSNGSGLYQDPTMKYGKDQKKCGFDQDDFFSNLIPCTSSSIQGIVQDIQHWNELPKENRLYHIFTKGNRLFYLVFFILSILTIVVLAKIAIQATQKKPTIPDYYIY